MRRVNSVNLLVSGVLVLAAAAGCYTGAHVEPNTSENGPTVSVDGTEPAVSDLPCDVAAVLAKSCTSCHGDTLKNDAPNRLMTHDDLMAVAKDGSGKTMLEIAIERMRDKSDPMPPDGVLPESDVAVLEAWAADGAQASTCAEDVPQGEDPYATATVCTSGTKWTKGDHGDKKMHPGGTCISCHSKEGSTKHEGDDDDDDEGDDDEAPLYTVAGTIFPTAHEPDDCNGTATGEGGALTVEITGADKKVTKLTPNTVGNFFATTAIKFPYTARVIAKDGSVRAMKDAQKDGDCNGCHTVKGTQKAPGRVMAP